MEEKRKGKRATVKKKVTVVEKKEETQRKKSIPPFACGSLLYSDSLRTCQ